MLGGVLVVAFLMIAAVAVAALPPGGTFTDDDGSTYEGSIEAIAAEGITQGCNPPDNTLFCPDDFVTRGQMAAFLHRALDDTLTPGGEVEFDDDNGNTFEADIEWLGATGVTRGCNPPDNTLFCPEDFVTRGQMAAFLTRALGLTPIDPPPPTSTTSTTTTTTPPNCDPSYPDVCIPPPPPQLACDDIPYSDFRVIGSDPHNFDGNNDGVGCQT